MIRRAAIIGLWLAAAGVVVMWVAASRSAQPINLYRDVLYTETGSVLVVCDGNGLRMNHWCFFDPPRVPKEYKAAFLGFGGSMYRRTTPLGTTVQNYRVWIPWWAVLTLVGLYPVWTGVCGLRRWRARRRHHLCKHCDYNLVGNVTGICPECGEPV